MVRRRYGFVGGAVDRLVASPVNYWVAMVTDLVTALLFLIVGLNRFAGSRALAGGIVLSGAIVWGLVEYGLHRWVLHGPVATIRREHRRHHAAPRALISAPVLLIPIASLATWRLLAWPLPAPVAALLVGGLYVGYNYYACLHHAQHQFGARLASVGPWRRLTRFHEMHHGLPNANFGISTTLWDRAFGTYRPVGAPPGHMPERLDNRAPEARVQ